MQFRFAYNSYQDVRHNPSLYAIPFLIGAGSFAYLRVLPSAHRGMLSEILDSAVWEGLSVVFVSACVSLFLTEILQAHDHWYDKRFVRWRRRSSIDFIIPRLVHPVASNLNYRFY